MLPIRFITFDYCVALGFLFSVIISFADSFTWRILNAYYRKSRKKIDQKWKYIFSIRSQCEFCHKPISLLYLIPVFGSLLTFFRCIHCKKQISKRFFLGELGAWIYGALLIYNNPYIGYILFSVFYFILAYLISMIDKEFLIIPTEALFLMILIAIVETLFFSNDVTLSFLVAFSWFSLFYLIRILSGYRMGLADVRLVFALSLGLSFPYSIYIPTLASLLGIGYHILESFYRKERLNLKKKTAFGLFLALAFLILRLLPAEHREFL